MRVSTAVREYVRKVVLAKVADKIEAAERAAKDATAARDAKVEKAKALCKKLCAETQAEFVKEVKKLGLTFIPDSCWNDELTVDHDDFVETLTSRNSLRAKLNPSGVREAFFELVDEPERIREAAEQAAEKLLFELELGKVAKKELDEALKELEVKL